MGACLGSLLVFLQEDDLVLRQVAEQGPLQGQAVDGLAEVVGEAFGEVFLLYAGDGVGGEADNGRFVVDAVFLLPDAVHGFGAIHAVHPLVHEDDVIGNLQGEGQGFLAAEGGIDLHFGFPEEAFDYGQVHAGVIHDQDFCIGGAEELPRKHFGFRAGIRLDVEFPDPLGGKDLLRNGDGEQGALAEFAFHPDGTAHHIQEVLGDGEPQAGAFHLLAAGGADAFEFFKEAGKVLLADADARVLHGEGEVDALAGHIAGDRGAGDGEFHVSVVGVLHGIIQDVDDYLAEAGFVPVDVVRKAGIHIHAEFQVPGLRPEADQAADVAEKRAEGIGAFPDFQLAGFDLGDVEDVVDDGQQVPAGGIDDAGISADVAEDRAEIPGGFRVVAGLQALPQDDLVHAHHGIDRGADLMAHVGQELTLGGVGPLGDLPGFAQLVVLRGALAEVDHEDRGDHEDHQDQGDDKEHDGNDVVDIGGEGIAGVLQHLVAHPGAQQDAAEREAQHHHQAGDLEQGLVLRVKAGAFICTEIGAADRPHHEEIAEAAQEGEGIIQFARQTVHAGGGPHAEFTEDKHESSQGDIRLRAAFRPVLPVPAEALDAVNGDGCADRHLVDIVDRAPIGQVEDQLGNVERDGNEHQGMEEAPFLPGFHVQQEDQQDHVGAVPAKVGHRIGNLRVSPHDDEVGGPVIGTQQVAEEEQDGERPTLLLNAYIVEKAQQKSDQVHQKLDDTFRVL